LIEENPEAATNSQLLYPKYIDGLNKKDKELVTTKRVEFRKKLYELVKNAI
jgi:hypothetical protein